MNKQDELDIEASERTIRPLNDITPEQHEEILAEHRARYNAFDLMYHMVLQEVLLRGADSDNRTGIKTRSMFGTQMRFDLNEKHPNDAPIEVACLPKFPAVTTKKLYWKAVVGELLGFLRGYDNDEQFRALGCNVWTANANAPAWVNNPKRRSEGDLGRVYGVQWRNWLSTTIERTYEAPHSRVSCAHTDQIRNLVDTIIHRPTDRRMIVTAWNPGELDQMALPPCHMFFQCACRPNNELDLHVYIRSNDLFLGAPFNIASYALLLHILCGLTWRDPGKLIYSLGDYHIYHSHLEQVKEQLQRKPYQPPSLKINWPSGNLEERWRWIMYEAVPADFILLGYEHHPPIRGEMAV